MSRLLLAAHLALALVLPACVLDDYDEDGFTSPDDCDNFDPTAFPGGIEVCDGVDNDCNGVVDDGVRLTFYQDLDQDGWGTATVTSDGCAAPEGYSWFDGDCDDTDGTRSPVAAEVCDGIDNDCDGSVDEGSEGETYYADTDRDGFGDPDAELVSDCGIPAGYVLDATDCDDTDRDVYPGAPERCNGEDDDCDEAVDSPTPADVVTFYADADEDGFGDATTAVTGCVQPLGTVLDATDCDDGDDATYPGAPEGCGIDVDRDCDGFDDRECASCLDHLENGDTTGDGLYEIDPDGRGPSPVQQVYCDMTTEGGGWTLALRTVYDWDGETDALLTGYAAWHDDTRGDATPGSAYRVAGRLLPFLQVEGDHLVRMTPRDTTGNSCDALTYTLSTGFFDVGAATTTVDLLPVGTIAPFRSTTLSTLDSGPSAWCASTKNAVPWFYASCCTTCPSIGTATVNTEMHPISIDVAVPDRDGLTAATACSPGTPATPPIAPAFTVLDVFEYYVR